MIEVEAKIWLKKQEIEPLKRQLEKRADFKGVELKKDTYYGKSKKSILRIREINEKTNFDIKLRKTEQGTELNQEIEFGLKDKKKFSRFLRKIGLKVSQSKAKKTQKYHYKNITIELNQVRGLGHFLEIEKLVKKTASIPKAKKEVSALFKELGFSVKRFEKRTYLELLQGS